MKIEGKLRMLSVEVEGSPSTIAEAVAAFTDGLSKMLRAAVEPASPPAQDAPGNSPLRGEEATDGHDAGQT